MRKYALCEIKKQVDPGNKIKMQNKYDKGKLDNAIYRNTTRRRWIFSLR